MRAFSARLRKEYVNMVEGSPTIRFGVFELDLHTRELRKAGRKVQIQEQPLRVLVSLLERPGELVTREELREILWQADTFVDFDTALNKAITKIRDVLADSAVSPRFVETLPKRGYRFIAAVEKPAELERVVNAGMEEQPPGRRRTGRGPVLLGCTMGAMILAVAGYFYFHRGPRLTDKDTIVLSDFTNRTGDPVFDGTLRQGLAIHLEQSPFLKIMDDEQVQQNLRLMSLPSGSHLTNQVAHDICVRDGAAATIDGSIASLGRAYVITLEANTCKGGETLAREQIQAEDKEHVLNAVGKAATAMRAKLGESLGSIEKLNLPLEQATTSSLEALQSYTAGYYEMGHGRFFAAAPLFERATVLDPNFAMAYAFLANTSYNAGDLGRTCEYSRKAFSLIDRVSEFERVDIAGNYYEDCTRELDKAIDARRLGSRNYPRFWGFHNNLSVVYAVLGQFEEAVKEGQEAARLQPSTEPHYANLLNAYIRLSRFDEAKELRKRAQAQGADGARMHRGYLEMAFAEGDRGAAEKEVQWFAGKPEEYISLGLQARNADSLGQRRKARDLYRRAGETALRRNLASVASDFGATDALGDALVGNCQTALRLGRPAVALAMCGDTSRAEKFTVDNSKLFPNGTIWNAVQLPAIRAFVAMKLDQPERSVELLAPAVPFERAYSEVPYLRGLALLQQHKGAEAAVEFRKIVGQKGAHWGLYYSLACLGLARAAAIAGDSGNATTGYHDFIAMWKDADSDIPILKQARADARKL